MTTDLAPTSNLDALLGSYDGDLPESSGTGLGTFIWLHGTNKSGAKTPGVFYVKDTELADLPDAPWGLDNRYEENDEPERGFSAAQLRIAPIIWHSQWFLPAGDDDRQRKARGPKNWISGYVEGAQKHLDLICLVEGITDPMVFSANGQNKCGAMLDILKTYRNGLQRQAQFRAKRADKSRVVPPWTYWLPIANQKTGDGKTVYTEVFDKETGKGGSVVTPPALFLPADAIDSLLVTPEQFRLGAEIYAAYLEWSREQRINRDTVEGSYTVENRPALPAPTHRNIPQPIENVPDL